MAHGGRIYNRVRILLHDHVSLGVWRVSQGVETGPSLRAFGHNARFLSPVKLHGSFNLSGATAQVLHFNLEVAMHFGMEYAPFDHVMKMLWIVGARCERQHSPGGEVHRILWQKRKLEFAKH